MKILQLCKSFPPDVGGIETVAYNLVQSLGALGVQNGVIAFGSESRVDYESYDGVSTPVYREKIDFWIKQAPLSFRYFIRFLRVMREYEAIIIHLPNPFAALCVLLSGYRGRVALYWHADIVGKGIYGVFVGPLERGLIRRADAVMGPTTVHITASYHANHFRGKAHIVPYPISRHSVATAGAREGVPRRISHSPVKLLAIGRLVPYKGFDVLIRALARVECDCHLDILGEGPLWSDLQSLAQQAGVTARLTFHGSVPEEVREQFLREADILCFPSVTKAEMFGMVQLEAMGYGVPVISTDIPGSGTPEFTRRSGGGLVVPPGDDAAFAATITRLIEDKELYTRLSAGGIATILDRTSQTNAVKRLVEICAGVD